jgi:hypothetical protein
MVMSYQEEGTNPPRSMSELLARLGELNGDEASDFGWNAPSAMIWFAERGDFRATAFMRAVLFEAAKADGFQALEFVNCLYWLFRWTSDADLGELFAAGGYVPPPRQAEWTIDLPPSSPCSPAPAVAAVCDPRGAGARTVSDDLEPEDQEWFARYPLDAYRVRPGFVIVEAATGLAAQASKMTFNSCNDGDYHMGDGSSVLGDEFELRHDDWMAGCLYSWDEPEE